MVVSTSGRAVSAGGYPSVGAGIIFAASVQKVGAIPSAPGDHLAASPHRSVLVSTSGRTIGARGCPGVGDGIISAAGVQKAVTVKSAPDDHYHFTFDPQRRVMGSDSRRAGGAGSCPNVGAGVVSAACI